MQQPGKETAMPINYNFIISILLCVLNDII